MPMSAAGPAACYHRAMGILRRALIRVPFVALLGAPVACGISLDVGSQGPTDGGLVTDATIPFDAAPKNDASAADVAVDTARPPRPDDGIKNGDETDVDCGGASAPKCGLGKTCVKPADCVTDLCLQGVCRAPSSTDGIKNADETDIDCGGTGAPKCDDAKACLLARDCTSGVCTGGVCQAPTATDGVKNGDETDVDCGGAIAPKCADTKACKLPADCASGVCTGGVCQAPTATDGVKNGDETDVDCGGAIAPKCADTKACLAPTDCKSGVCTGNVCQAPTSTDGIKNGDESDVDCGGTSTAAPKCKPGMSCVLPRDCDNGLCTGGTCPDVYLFGLNHVLSTGQSNSVANGGSPVLTTTQPFNNKMFNGGVMTSLNCDGNGCLGYDTPTSLVPLTEGDKFFNYAIETMSSGLGNEASRLARDLYLTGNPVATTQDVMVSLHGRSGNAYPCIRKGGCPGWFPGKAYVLPFSEGILQATDGKRLATAAGLSYAVRGVTIIHGESDHYGYATLYPMAGADGTPSKIKNYADAMIELQSDYETAIRGVTGQTVPVPLYMAQMHSWVGDASVSFSAVTRDQYLAHKRAPGKVVLVAPTYPLVFGDALHFSNVSNRRLGEYFAKAYAKVTLTGQPWEPLRPSTVTRAGNVITVKFLVPAPPIVLDTTRVSNPGNYGFEYTDGSGAPPAITAVAVTAPDTVQITLAAAPTGPNRVVRYAFTRVGGSTAPGPTTGVRGNLRDSDATPSNYGNELQNWCVTFEEAVP